MHPLTILGRQRTTPLARAVATKLARTGSAARVLALLGIEPPDRSKQMRHSASTGAKYYDNKIDSLRDLFGTEDVLLQPGSIEVGGRIFPVVDDVIITLDTDRLPLGAAGIEGATLARTTTSAYAPDIQRTFSQEWLAHPRILPEHKAEFDRYFDLVDLTRLNESRLCDLGCGIGRWSYFLAARCNEIVLVDYSEAIFVARENLRSATNAIFVMADVLDLPFRNDAFDLVYCLGVLHHLPIDALDALRSLRRLAPRQLVYLYYALDNRPTYFRWILRAVTVVRRRLANVRSERVRLVLSWLLGLTVYRPLAGLGSALRPLGLEKYVPLAESYSGKSLPRIRQDVYDRFFTGIEQRFTRDQILELLDTFSSVEFSEELPYWHFICERSRNEGITNSPE